MSITFDKPIIYISNNTTNSISQCQEQQEYGFIIVRNVLTDRHNTLWLYNYNNIRKYYPSDIKIMIVDDNSSFAPLYKLDSQYLASDPNLSIYYISEHAPELLSCGEILGYYMFNKIKPPFKYAIVIHDSAIINKSIDFNEYIAKIKPNNNNTSNNTPNNTFNNECLILWDFEHRWDNFDHISILLSKLDNNGNLIELMKNLSKWVGCFGIMSIVSNNYLTHINNKYGILQPEKIKNLKNSRDMRMALERVWGIIYYNECQTIHPPIFGNIHKYYANNGFNFWYDNLNDFNAGKFAKLPIVKIWNGR